MLIDYDRKKISYNLVLLNEYKIYFKKKTLIDFFLSILRYLKGTLRKTNKNLKIKIKSQKTLMFI